jgi:hypothetical protein
METFLLNKDAYPVMAVVASGLTVAIIFVAHFWYKLRRAEMELGLKQAMIERGMSAEEICKVIESGHSGKPDPEPEQRAHHSCKAKTLNRF